MEDLYFSKIEEVAKGGEENRERLCYLNCP